MKKNFVFFGSPEFASTILEKLIGAGFVPLAVVCNPDRPVGRKKIITSPPVKQRIMEYEARSKEKIQLLQPEKLNEEFLTSYSRLLASCNFAVVAAYSKIIPREIIDIFPHGVIGVHPSLLPKYRGATPIQSVILAGEEETGTTLFMIDEKVDHGPILAKRKLEYPISSIQYTVLLQKLAKLSGQLLTETLPKFASGEIEPQQQDESLATNTKKFSTEDAFIAPEKLGLALSGKNQDVAREIERKTRALNPEPGTWTTKNGKRVKLIEAEIVNEKIVIKKIQIEGKTPQTPQNTQSL